MDILYELKSERDRIDAAIRALSGNTVAKNGRRGRSAGRRQRGRRQMSPAARARISAAQKKRWAAVKAAQRTTAATKKK